MALHVADDEVTRLVAQLAKMENTTKTEVLRRVLRAAVVERQREAKRKDFREFALRLVTEGRKKKVRPVTKSEMDKLWGMDSLDGD